MSQTASYLQTIIDQVRPQLLELNDQQAAQAPAPEKWSPKQIIGHLIDSASNNHQRFMRAQFMDDLIFPGYQQEEWVKLQDYAAADWSNLVQLWYHFNWQIARVIANVPNEKRHQLRPKHNLHQIAMYRIPEDQPTTLEYFMLDYVKHLEGHIRQILLDYEAVTLEKG